jgi:hypothetical protein
MKPKSLSKKSSAIFEKIIARIPEGQGHVRIGEPGGPIMPLSVERLFTCNDGMMYSLTHYYYQNGDPCRDPEMCFLKTKTGDVFACTFEQSIPPFHQESLFFEDGKWKLHPRMQRDHASFANGWMKNIEWQQEL